MRVIATDYMSTDIINEAYRVQENLRLEMLELINRIVYITKPNTTAGILTMPFPELINIIERNIDAFTVGGYMPPDMQPTVDWKGEFFDMRRLSYIDVNRWFETIERISALIKSIESRALITGKFATGNDRMRQIIRSV